MKNLEMTHVVLDLESGSRHHRRLSTGDEEDSVCFSNSDNDDGDIESCYSQFYSNYDSSTPITTALTTTSLITTTSDRFRILPGCRIVLWTLKGGAHEFKLHLGKEERDCRICHMNLVVVDDVDDDDDDDDGVDNGVAMELGCCCKDDLAMAHKNCAETWFKIKGNKTCEICNSIARNVIGFNETTTTTTQQTDETNAVTTTTTSASTENSRRRSCLNGHRFLNFLLACMVFAFVISWLFHFNIPS